MKYIKSGFATLTVVLVVMTIAALITMLSGYQTYQMVKTEQEGQKSLEAYNNALSGFACASEWMSTQSGGGGLPLGNINYQDCLGLVTKLSISGGAQGRYLIKSTGYSVDNVVSYDMYRVLVKGVGMQQKPTSPFISKGSVDLRGGSVFIIGGEYGLISGGTISTDNSTIDKGTLPNADFLKNTLPSDYYFGTSFTSANAAFKKTTCEEFKKELSPVDYLKKNKNVWLVMNNSVCIIPTNIAVGNPVGDINQVEAVSLIIENLSGSNTPALKVGDGGNGTLMMSGLFAFIDKDGKNSVLNLQGSFNITGSMVTDSGFSTVGGSLTMMYNSVVLDAINKSLSKFDFIRGTWNDF
ncbi:hypothetical protein [Plesiomonas sp.]|uniref:hypothetical protein n=1 Tax=Plesiomonas sp. TaxID=2486279 RepID=UPI003F31E948